MMRYVNVSVDILLLPVSEYKRPPYYSSTCGLDFDLIIVNQSVNLYLSLIIKVHKSETQSKHKRTSKRIHYRPIKAILGNMASQPNLIVNEVLWYIQQYYDKVTKTDLSSVLINFYTFDEIAFAKLQLFGVAENVDAVSLPVHTERKGANKVRATVDDIIGLYALLDVNKICLPQYVVLDPKRVPMSGSTNSEQAVAVSALTSLVHELKDQVAALTEKLNAVCGGHSQSHVVDVGAVATGSSNVPGLPAHNVMGNQLEAVSEPPSNPHSSSSFADKAALLRSAHEPFKPRPPAVQRTGSGKGKPNDKVKAVPRWLVCFVGRLHRETTEEDLRNYLADAGIKDAFCRKLEDKNGFFKTAAFRVSCRAEYHDLFYNEASWPEGVELRDWIFRRHDGSTR